MSLKKIVPALGVLLTAIILYCVINLSVTQEARVILNSECPELIWLKKEYHLSDQQFSKIEALHYAHDKECMEQCKQLAAKQKALRQAVIANQIDSPEFQILLLDWREQRKQSQDSILEHMFEVSAEMSPDQGQRYRENVFQSLILPGRTPHINDDGEYNPAFIERRQR